MEFVACDAGQAPRGTSCWFLLRHLAPQTPALPLLFPAPAADGSLVRRHLLFLLALPGAIPAEESFWCEPLKRYRTLAFEATVMQGEQLVRPLGNKLFLVVDLTGGIRIAGAPASSDNFAGAVLAPLRGNYVLDLAAWHFARKPSYFDAVDRRFQFVLSPRDYQRVTAEWSILTQPGQYGAAELQRARQMTARTACGEGRLLIQDVELAAPEEIRRLRFRVEFRVPGGF